MFHVRDGAYWVDRNIVSPTDSGLLVGQDDLLGKWHRIEVHALWSQSDGFL